MVFATLYHKGSSLAFQISISQLRDPQFGTRAFLLWARSTTKKPVNTGTKRSIAKSKEMTEDKAGG